MKKDEGPGCVIKEALAAAASKSDKRKILNIGALEALQWMARLAFQDTLAAMVLLDDFKKFKPDDRNKIKTRLGQFLTSYGNVEGDDGARGRTSLAPAIDKALRAMLVQISSTVDDPVKEAESLLDCIESAWNELQKQLPLVALHEVNVLRAKTAAFRRTRKGTDR